MTANHPPAIHTVNTVEQTTYIQATVVETFHPRLQEQLHNTLVYNQSSDRLSEESIIAAMIAEQKFEAVYGDVFYSLYNGDPEEIEPGQWRHNVSFVQYYLGAPEDRNVELKIPQGDLPQNYTHTDIIQWGKDQRLLNP